MEAKCLVSKLKSVVDNDNLHHLGSMVLHTSGTGVRVFQLISGVDSRLRIIGDGNFLNSDSSVIGKTLNITGNTNTTVRLSSGTYDVEFYNSKAITKLAGISSEAGIVFYINADDIALKCSNLASLDLKYMVCTGNLSQLIHMESLVNFTCNGVVVDGSNFYANINDEVSTKKSINLTSNISGNITGDINNFKNWGAEINAFYWKNTSLSGELSTLFDAIAQTIDNNSTLSILPNTITTLNGVATTAEAKTVTFSDGNWTIS